MKEQYRKQVALLIQTLPYIAKEHIFALKGGTAINLFYRDMPRLSVDIDLTYNGFEARSEAILAIDQGLERIKTDLNKRGMVVHTQGNPGNLKLIVTNKDSSIKIEPNYTIHGYVYAPVVMSVRPVVETIFSWAEIHVGSPPDVWGGKICAALDRQHPRDLFDVEELIGENNIDQQITTGFIAMLLSHNRPIHELIDPIIKNQKPVFDKEFLGMTDSPYSYDNHCENIKKLIWLVQKSLIHYQSFLHDFISLSKEIDDAIIPNASRLPAIQWKQKNLMHLKDTNIEKYEKQLISLDELFDKMVKLKHH